MASGLHGSNQYTPAQVSNTKYFFAYDASLDPDRMAAVSPGATFQFIAHYPETRLDFVEVASAEPIATLVRDPGNTVWGGVFSIPSQELPDLVAGLGEGRETGFDQKAVDREGNKHDCLAFVSPVLPGDQPVRPSSEYVAAMIRGARHWNLPAGWVMGLEDLAEDPLFT